MAGKSNLGSLIILMGCPSGLVLLVGAARGLCEVKYAYAIWTMLCAATRNDAHFLTIGKAYAAFVAGFESAATVHLWCSLFMKGGSKARHFCNEWSLRVLMLAAGVPIRCACNPKLRNAVTRCCIFGFAFVLFDTLLRTLVVRYLMGLQALRAGHDANRTRHVGGFNHASRLRLGRAGRRESSRSIFIRAKAALMVWFMQQAFRRRRTPLAAGATTWTCAICLESRGCCCQTTCGHVFHAACMRQWLEQGHDDCPLCRRCQRLKAVLRA